MTTDLTTLHYLYIEDDPLSRQVLKMILQNGISAEKVTIFEDSADFMSRLRELPSKPDIILMDIQMKPLSGFEMLKLLRQDADYLNIPVVALTASVMNEEVQKLRQAGFDSGISKPVSVTTLPVLLRKVISGEPVWHIV